MCRKTLGVVIVGLSCLLPARIGRGQDDDSSSKRSPTLGERLEQFRDDLLGEPRTKRRPENGKSSNGNSKNNNTGNGNRVGSNQKRSSGQPQGQARPSQDATNAANNRESDEAEQPTKPVARQAENSERTTVHRATGGQPPAAAPTVPPVAARAPEPMPPTPRTAPMSSEAPMTLEAKLSAARQATPPKATTIQPVTELPTARIARTQSNDMRDRAPEKRSEPAPKHNSSGNLLFSGQSPVLSVEAAGPRKIMIGREATFVVKVRNAGDAIANNVVVAVNIPVYAELAGSQTSNGSVRAPSGTEHREPLEWKISRLDAHSRETLTLRLVPHKSIPLDLAVQWSCSPDVTQTLVEVQEPKLMMALAGPEEILFGKSKMYKLTVSNPGNGDAENVLVSLQPIGKATEAAASQRLGTVRAGESKSVEVELTARQSGTLTIRAQAFADGGIRAETSEQVLVRRAMLKIETEAPRVKYAGTASVYRIRVSNHGNAAAQNVRLSALLPPDAKYISGDAGSRLESNHGKVNWQAGNLQPGADRIFEMQCALNAAGDNVVQFNAIADDDVSSAATASTRVEAMADLKLEVRDPQGPVPVGEDTVYEVVVRNRGTKSAEGIELVLFFSEGLEATAVQGGGHEIGAGQVVFKPIAVLQAGGESVFRVHTKADRGGNHVFRAEVVCQSLQSKLAAEQTTRFYGEDAFGESPQASRASKRIGSERSDAAVLGADDR